MCLNMILFAKNCEQIYWKKEEEGISKYSYKQTNSRHQASLPFGESFSLVVRVLLTLCAPPCLLRSAAGLSSGQRRWQPPFFFFPFFFLLLAVLHLKIPNSNHLFSFSADFPLPWHFSTRFLPFPSGSSLSRSHNFPSLQRFPFTACRGFLGRYVKLQLGWSHRHLPSMCCCCWHCYLWDVFPTVSFTWWLRNWVLWLDGGGCNLHLFPIWRPCLVGSSETARAGGSWWRCWRLLCIWSFFFSALCLFVLAQTLGWTFLLMGSYFSFGLYL